MFEPAFFGSGIGSIRCRATWSGAGLVTATPGWRGFTSNALSTVIGGIWAEAVRPNPDQSVSVASTRIVNREVAIRSVLRDSGAALSARNNKHNRLRQTARTGLRLEGKKKVSRR